MSDKSLFTSVVFAGGGSRCLWQVGFWSQVAPGLDLAPKIVAGVSAGATMACTIFAGRESFALQWMKRATSANRRNYYPGNVFRPGKKVFPHLAIYRRALLTALDEVALKRLHCGPDIRVLFAQPPRWAGPHLAVFVGGLCYAIEKKMHQPVHSEWAAKAGFKGVVAGVRDCRTPEELADLLLASSCTPPVIPVMYRDNTPVLDGGLVDNAPVGALGPDPGPTLILLTRRYPLHCLPSTPGRIYVQPSETVAVNKWDYTNPGGLQKAYDLGRRDGDNFVRLYHSLAPGEARPKA
jgi:hypothetical protein